MTKEQKAKAYDEAIERARKLYNSEETSADVEIACETIFPELTESEDERIRKELLAVVNDLVLPHEQQSRFVAWLEKQGEQKPKDKDKPKFHEGDWTVSDLDGKARQIAEVHYDEYNSYYVVDGNPVNLEEYDRLHHIWTLQEAKDGDVLATSAGAFIYNGNNGGGGCPGCYCGINTLGRFKTGVEHHWTGKKTYPATKEQRDLLFQKMKEAGYEWDAEKKELKRIEQKPAWSEEDEKMFKETFALIETVEDMNNAQDMFGDVKNWLKSLKDRLQVQPQNVWISVDKEVYVKEPILAQKKDKSDPFEGYVVCCDHTIAPNIYERYIRLDNNCYNNR